MRRKKHYPPSRVRYEKSHPTVTARVPVQLYQELKSLKAAGGLSVADVLKVGLDKAKPTVQEAYDKGHKTGFHEGYTGGWVEAREEYEVTFWCSRCRSRHLSITTAEGKEAAANFMYQAGWYSTHCPE